MKLALQVGCHIHPLHQYAICEFAASTCAAEVLPDSFRHVDKTHGLVSDWAQRRPPPSAQDLLKRLPGHDGSTPIKLPVLKLLETLEGVWTHILCNLEKNQCALSTYVLVNINMSPKAALHAVPDNT